MSLNSAPDRAASSNASGIVAGVDDVEPSVVPLCKDDRRGRRGVIKVIENGNGNDRKLSFHSMPRLK